MKRVYPILLYAVIALTILPILAMIIFQVKGVEVQLCWIYILLTLIAGANLASFITAASYNQWFHNVKTTLYIIVNVVIVCLNFGFASFIAMIL